MQVSRIVSNVQDLNRAPGGPRYRDCTRKVVGAQDEVLHLAEGSPAVRQSVAQLGVGDGPFEEKR